MKGRSFMRTRGLCRNDLDGQRVFARTYTGLELCDGVVNTYTYEVAENEGVEVALRHDTAQGDIALEIIEETDEGRVSGRVDGVYGAEVLAVLPTGRARTVSIVVSGRAGSPTTYMLSIQSLAQGSWTRCLVWAARQSQPGPRDHRWGGRLSLNLCANTQDWYRLPVPPGVTLSVAVDEPQEGLGLRSSAQIISASKAHQTQKMIRLVRPRRRWRREITTCA